MRNRNYVRWLSLAAVLLSGGLLMYAQRGVAPGRGPARGPGLPVVAGPGGPGERMGQGRALEVLTQYLDLTEDQVSQIREILSQVGERVTPVRQQIHELRGSLREALESGSPDAAQVGNWVIQIHQFRQEIRSIHQAAMEEVQGVLTPDQLAKLEELKTSKTVFPVLRALRDLNWYGGPSDDAEQRGPVKP